MLRDELANYAHESWSRWMRHLFSLSHENSNGSVTIPAHAVLRWKRQIVTAYEDLPEHTKKLDLKEADKILHICALD